MMKHNILLIIYFFLFPLIPLASQEKPDWENPQVVRINKEEPRATSISYPSVDDARNNQKSNNPWFILLNSNWKFNWFEKPSEVPGNFYRPDYEVDYWNEIPVPANWELEGYGIPIYVNTRFEFTDDPQPPAIPHEYNPVGLYRKDFNVPQEWANREVFIHFGSVKSAFYIWVNGEKAGYSQDSKTPAEFNITPYIKSGQNVLAMKVYRWSDGSYLECQDFWRISGIQRDVFLYSTPKVHIRDFWARAQLDENYRNGIFELDVDLINFNDKARNRSHSLEVILFDDLGEEVFRKVKNVKLQRSPELKIQFKTEIENPRKWTAETPDLYKLVLNLRDKNEQTIEAKSCDVGFRTVEIKKGQLLVNGVPI